jgi:hypothetical protein
MMAKSEAVGRAWRPNLTPTMISPSPVRRPVREDLAAGWMT